VWSLFQCYKLEFHTLELELIACKYMLHVLEDETPGTRHSCSCSFVPASVLLVTYSFKLERIACELEQTKGHFDDQF
jgi:hypothetical protein